MPLTTNSITPLVSAKKIKIWKIFGIDDEYGVSVLYTPTMGIIIRELPCEMVGRAFGGGVLLDPEKDADDNYIVGEGYIHAYSSKRGARKEMQEWYENTMLSRYFGHKRPYDVFFSCIVEGYIPKDTKYYTETDTDKPSHICTKRMIMERIYAVRGYDDVKYIEQTFNKGQQFKPIEYEGLEWE